MRSQFLLVTLLCYSVKGFTQSSQNDSLPNATLPACIQYALTHQPHIQQSLLDEKLQKQPSGQNWEIGFPDQS